MLGLKIFVQIQTFRRRLFVLSYNFCHPVREQTLLVVLQGTRRRSEKEIVTQSFWNRNEKLFVEIVKGQLCRREATEGGGTWQPQNRNLFKPLFLRTTTCYPQREFSMEENKKKHEEEEILLVLCVMHRNFECVENNLRVSRGLLSSPRGRVP